MVVYATNKSIKLLRATMEQDGFGGGEVYNELRCTDETSEFIAVRFADNLSSKLLVAQ